MSKFRIEPHGRLQEWVAEEKGYFKDEGLDQMIRISFSEIIRRELKQATGRQF